MEKMKKTAILGSLKSVKAFRPRASTRDFFSEDWLVGQCGSVNAYTASTRPMLPLTTN